MAFPGSTRDGNFSIGPAGCFLEIDFSHELNKR